MVKLWQFWKGRPKPAFSEKVQRGDQVKFFKNRPKSSPPLKGPTALSRKWHYPLISMHLNCRNWRRFWRKQRLQKCPNTQLMAILARSPPFERLNSTLAEMALSSNYNALKLLRLEKIFGQKAASKVTEWPSYGNFRKVTQNPHFLKKCKEGTKGNFSKIALKVALVSKAQKHSGANIIIL